MARTSQIHSSDEKYRTVCLEEQALKNKSEGALSKSVILFYNGVTTHKSNSM